MDLTPEEKQRIYEEEKVRLQAQEQIKATEKTKSTGIGCLVVIALVVVVWIISSLGGDSLPASGVATEAQKTEIIEFEKQIYATEKIATNAIEAYKTTMTDFSNGKATIYEAYSAASAAKDKCKDAQFAFHNIKTPQITKEITKQLDDAKSDIGTAYMVKAEALDSVMKFLDSQKPSDMQNYEDSIKSADSHVMNAVLNLMKAKEKAGISLTQ